MFNPQHSHFLWTLSTILFLTKTCNGGLLTTVTNTIPAAGHLTLYASILIEVNLTAVGSNNPSGTEQAFLNIPNAADCFHIDPGNPFTVENQTSGELKLYYQDTPLINDGGSMTTRLGLRLLSGAGCPIWVVDGLLNPSISVGQTYSYFGPFYFDSPHQNIPVLSNNFTPLSNSILAVLVGNNDANGAISYHGSSSLVGSPIQVQEVVNSQVVQTFPFTSIDGVGVVQGPSSSLPLVTWQGKNPGFALAGYRSFTPGSGENFNRLDWQSCENDPRTVAICNSTVDCEIEVLSTCHGDIPIAMVSSVDGRWIYLATNNFGVTILDTQNASYSKRMIDYAGFYSDTMLYYPRIIDMKRIGNDLYVLQEDLYATPTIRSINFVANLSNVDPHNLPVFQPQRRELPNLGPVLSENLPTDMLGFFFASLNPSLSQPDTVYITIPAGLVKWSKNSSNVWTETGFLDSTSGYWNQISGKQITLTNVQVYLVGKNGTEIWSIVDTAGYNQIPQNPLKTLQSTAPQGDFTYRGAQASFNKPELVWKITTEIKEGDWITRTLTLPEFHVVINVTLVSGYNLDALELSAAPLKMWVKSGARGYMMDMDPFLYSSPSSFMDQDDFNLVWDGTTDRTFDVGQTRSVTIRLYWSGRNDNSTCDSGTDGFIVLDYPLSYQDHISSETRVSFPVQYIYDPQNCQFDPFTTTTTTATTSSRTTLLSTSSVKSSTSSLISTSSSLSTKSSSMSSSMSSTKSSSSQTTQSSSQSSSQTSFKSTTKSIASTSSSQATTLTSVSNVVSTTLSSIVPSSSVSSTIITTYTSTVVGTETTFVSTVITTSVTESSTSSTILPTFAPVSLIAGASFTPDPTSLFDVNQVCTQSDPQGLARGWSILRGSIGYDNIPIFDSLQAAAEVNFTCDRLGNGYTSFVALFTAATQINVMGVDLPYLRTNLTYSSTDTTLKAVFVYKDTLRFTITIDRHGQGNSTLDTLRVLGWQMDVIKSTNLFDPNSFLLADSLTTGTFASQGTSIGTFFDFMRGVNVIASLSYKPSFDEDVIKRDFLTLKIAGAQWNDFAVDFNLTLALDKNTNDTLGPTSGLKATNVSFWEGSLSVAVMKGDQPVLVNFTIPRGGFCQDLPMSVSALLFPSEDFPLKTPLLVQGTALFTCTPVVGQSAAENNQPNVLPRRNGGIPRYQRKRATNALAKPVSATVMLQANEFELALFDNSSTLKANGTLFVDTETKNFNFTGNVGQLDVFFYQSDSKFVRLVKGQNVTVKDYGFSLTSNNDIQLGQLPFAPALQDSIGSGFNDVSTFTLSGIVVNYNHEGGATLATQKNSLQLAAGTSWSNPDGFNASIGVKVDVKAQKVGVQRWSGVAQGSVALTLDKYLFLQADLAFASGCSPVGNLTTRTTTSTTSTKSQTTTTSSTSSTTTSSKSSTTTTKSTQSSTTTSTTVTTITSSPTLTPGSRVARITGFLTNLPGLNGNNISLTGTIVALVPCRSNNPAWNSTVYNLTLSTASPLTLDIMDKPTAQLSSVGLEYYSKERVLKLGGAVAFGQRAAGGVTFAVSARFNLANIPLKLVSNNSTNGTLTNNTLTNSTATNSTSKGRIMEGARFEATISGSPFSLANLPISGFGTGLQTSGGDALLPISGTSFKGKLFVAFNSSVQKVENITSVVDYITLGAQIMTNILDVDGLIVIRRRFPLELLDFKPSSVNVSTASNSTNSSAITNFSTNRWEFTYGLFSLSTQFGNVSLEANGAPCDGPLKLNGNLNLPMISTQIFVSGRASFSCQPKNSTNTTVANATSTSVGKQVVAYDLSANVTTFFEVFDSNYTVSVGLGYSKKLNNTPIWKAHAELGFSPVGYTGSKGVLFFDAWWNNSQNFDLTVGAQNLAFKNLPFYQKLAEKLNHVRALDGLLIKGADLTYSKRQNKQSFKATLVFQDDADSHKLDANLTAIFTKTTNNATSSWNITLIEFRTGIYIPDVNTLIDVDLIYACGAGLGVKGTFGGVFGFIPKAIPFNMFNGSLSMPCVAGKPALSNFTLQVALPKIDMQKYFGWTPPDFNIPNNSSLIYSRATQTFSINWNYGDAKFIFAFGKGVVSPTGVTEGTGTSKMGVRISGSLGGNALDFAAIGKFFGKMGAGTVGNNPDATFGAPGNPMQTELNKKLSVGFTKAEFDLDSSGYLNVRCAFTLYGVDASLMLMAQKGVSGWAVAFGAAVIIPSDPAKLNAMPVWLKGLVARDEFKFDVFFIGVSSGAATFILPNTYVPPSNTGGYVGAVKSEIKLTGMGIGIYGKVRFNTANPNMKKIMGNTGAFGSSMGGTSGSLAFSVVLSATDLTISIGFEMTHTSNGLANYYKRSQSELIAMELHHLGKRDSYSPGGKTATTYAGVSLELSIGFVSPSVSFALAFEVTQTLNDKILTFKGALIIAINSLGGSLEGRFEFHGRPGWVGAFGIPALTLSDLSLGLALNMQTLIPTKIAVGLAGSLGPSNLVGCIKVDLGNVLTGNTLFLNVTNLSMGNVICSIVPPLGQVKGIKDFLDAVYLKKGLLSINPTMNVANLGDCVPGLTAPPGFLLNIEGLNFFNGLIVVQQGKLQIYTGIPPYIDAAFVLAPINLGGVVQITSATDASKGLQAFFHVDIFSLFFKLDAKIVLFKSITATCFVNISMEVKTHSMSAHIETSLRLWNAADISLTIDSRGSTPSNWFFQLQFMATSRYHGGLLLGLIQGVLDNLQDIVNQRRAAWKAEVDAGAAKAKADALAVKEEGNRAFNNAAASEKAAYNNAIAAYNYGNWRLQGKADSCNYHEGRCHWWRFWECIEAGICWVEYGIDWLAVNAAKLFADARYWIMMGAINSAQAIFNGVMDTYVKAIAAADKLIKDAIDWIAQVVLPAVRDAVNKLVANSINLQFIKADTRMTVDSFDFSATLGIAFGSNPTSNYTAILSTDIKRSVTGLWSVVKQLIADLAYYALKSVGAEPFAANVRNFIKGLGTVSARHLDDMGYLEQAVAYIEYGQRTIDPPSVLNVSERVVEIGMEREIDIPEYVDVTGKDFGACVLEAPQFSL